MQPTGRIWSLALLAAALLTLTAGSVRAFDLGPGTGALDEAAQVDHDQHGQQPAERAPHDKPTGHARHRQTAVVLPTRDDGRYSLQLDQQTVPVGSDELSFTIIDESTHKPLTQYEIEQAKRLHLIVIREDLTGFQHVHPTLDGNGTWSTREAVLDRPGSWRMIADFVPAGGKQTVLATDVRATGALYRARPFRESERTGGHRWRTDTGRYEVTLTAERYAAGANGTLRFTIERSGRAVAHLQPYLGALGHAVLLRRTDLAYSHVHPRIEPPAPGVIEFDTIYPEGAPVGLFLQFRHNGRIRTAKFLLPEPPAGSPR